MNTTQEQHALLNLQYEEFKMIGSERADTKQVLRKYLNNDCVNIIDEYARKLLKTDDEFLRIKRNINCAIRRFIGKGNRQLKSNLKFVETYSDFCVSVKLSINHFSAVDDKYKLFYIDRDTLKIKMSLCENCINVVRDENDDPKIEIDKSLCKGCAKEYTSSNVKSVFNHLLNSGCRDLADILNDKVNELNTLKLHNLI